MLRDPTWESAHTSNTEILERLQTKIQRVTVNAAWYVPNAGVTIKGEMCQYNGPLHRLTALPVRYGDPDSSGAFKALFTPESAARFSSLTPQVGTQKLDTEQFKSHRSLSLESKQLDVHHGTYTGRDWEIKKKKRNHIYIRNSASHHFSP